MKLSWSQDETDFRQEVREFIATHLPRVLRDKVYAHQELGRKDFVSWARILNDRGWMGWNWPVEFGGPGWSPIQTHIFEEEMWIGGAPEVFAFGPKMLAPLLMQFGTNEQRDYLLPRIRSAEDWWCQGYSEPNAGSDLASLRTAAVIDGDQFVINGQKAWTTYGHYANKMFLLARTDPDVPKQKGISFILLDMETPGITVRPVVLMDGVHEVNEVFFDDVRVPLSNLVGELNKGWTCAKALLADERINAGKLGRTKRELRLLKRIANRPGRNGQRLINDLRYAERVARIEVDILALEYMTLRLLSDLSAGKVVGAEASLLKWRGTEIAQAISLMLVDAIAPDLHAPGSTATNPADPLPQALVRQYLNWRKLAIYGGSNEVQHNIVAKAALGL